MFSELGVPVIDTDAIARELVEPEQPALDEIVGLMGPIVLNADGALDRATVRKLVFENPALRTALESILHPLIFEVVENRVRALGSPYVMLVVPLLVESGQTSIADRVLVVDLPGQLQRERTMARDNIDPDLVDRILASQCRREERLAIADDVIDNSGPPNQLRGQIEILHRRYLDLSENDVARNQEASH